MMDLEQLQQIVKLKMNTYVPVPQLLNKLVSVWSSSLLPFTSLHQKLWRNFLSTALVTTVYFCQRYNAHTLSGFSLSCQLWSPFRPQQTLRLLCSGQVKLFILFFLCFLSSQVLIF